MEIITAGDRKLVVCPHCKGSSLCQFSTIVWWEEDLEETIRFYALRCNKCGKGIEKDKEKDLVAPVCSICEGRGYLPIR